MSVAVKLTPLDPRDAPNAETPLKQAKLSAAIAVCPCKSTALTVANPRSLETTAKTATNDLPWSAQNVKRSSRPLERNA